MTTTLESLLKTDLRRQFEDAARGSRRQPVEVLAELMAEYVESNSDTVLFDEIESEGRSRNEYTEDDAVELVRRARRERALG